MIYFIQQGTDGPIKVGYTDKEVNCRLRKLQTGNHLQLSCRLVMEGELVDERRLHEQFGLYWIRGEWFWPAQEITDYISCMASQQNSAEDNLKTACAMVTSPKERSDNLANDSSEETENITESLISPEGDIKI